MQMERICVLYVLASGRMGRLIDVPTWRRFARMFLRIGAENSGTVIPLCDYSQKVGIDTTQMPYLSRFGLAHACGDCARWRGRAPAGAHGRAGQAIADQANQLHTLHHSELYRR